MDLEDIVSKYQPRQLLLIPAGVVALALIILGATWLTTGSPVHLGVEFTGGTIITVPATTTEEALSKQVANYPLLDIRQLGGRYQMQFGPMDDSEYSALAKLITTQYQDAEIRYMGPVYSQGLQQQAIQYIPLSFLFMALVVLVIFRTPMVSGIVVGCAVADILIAAASMNIMGIELSLGTVAALLMLIGYSVDTDILLTKTALTPRRTLTVDQTIVSAMRTGLMMTGTTIAAVLALFITSNVLYLVIPGFQRMGIIADISTVLLFGLAADVFNTWITNAQAIRWYMNRPKKTAAGRQKR